MAGDRIGALSDLRGAVDRGLADALITTGPDLDTLRSDPAFEAILARVQERARFRREISGGLFPWQ